MITVEHVCVSFRSEHQKKWFGSSRTQVLFDVNLTIPKGSCVGILGESGSGKSTLGRVICGLLKPDSGNVSIDGVSIYGDKKGKKLLQQKLSVVFQDYTTSANPRFSMKEILLEGIRARERKGEQVKDVDAELSHLLSLVGLDDSFLPRFPHELSGGQLQRVCIARAVACKPELILFDEAISSLDAHTQVQIMDLLQELEEKLSLTYLFITHDLTSITYLCDEVLFLYHGHVTDHRPVSTLSQTTDDYAKKLLQSIFIYDNEKLDEAAATAAGL